MKNKPFLIGSHVIEPGEKKYLEFSIPSLYSHAVTSMPVYIKNGKEAGPVLLITSAIHGDEINGIEIIRRLFSSKKINKIKGTIIAIPVVNIYGLFTLSRYLPDRRDLNRSFPGSSKGSLAARIANLIATEFIPKANCILDLHTASIHKENLPQIRTNLSSRKSKELSMAFGTPIIIDANIRDGSLRQAAFDNKIPVLVYEAGEALRFDELSIRYGLNGILNILSSLKMNKSKKIIKHKPQIAKNTSWIRSPISGLLYLTKKLGSTVSKDEIIGQIFDPFLAISEPLISNKSGIIIGKTNLPLINEGDAVANIAETKLHKNIKADLINVEDISLEEI